MTRRAALQIAFFVLSATLIALMVAVVVALGAHNGHAVIDLQFVSVLGAVDNKPAYVNPRAVAWIGPYGEGVTRIGFIGGDVKSVVGGVDQIKAALLAPPHPPR